MTDRYKNILSKECKNLSSQIRHQTLRLPIHRDAAIQKAVDVLARQRSVLIVGPEGVGKTAVIHGIAGHLQQHPDSKHKRVIEISTSVSLSGTKYLGEWESKSDAIISEAKSRKAVLYYNDIWNMPRCGSSSNNPSSLLDLVKPKLVQADLLLIGEATPEILQSMQAVPGFVKLFEVIYLEPLTIDQMLEVLEERTRELSPEFDRPILQRIHALCDQFLPENAGPGPAINLIDQIISYQEQKKSIDEPVSLTVGFIEKVFSIYSGLPLFIIDRESTLKVADIRQWFRERIIGQEEAIESIIEAIVLYKSALHDPTRPIGSFMFVGPTGVGKTELAKALATYLFGSEQKLLRFDMSEFAEPRAYKTLIGEPGVAGGSARLIDPVRQQPFQLILFDELEKGNINVRDLLLQILDDGRLTPPTGNTVSFRNTLIIATSNVGASVISKGVGGSKSVGFVSPSSTGDTAKIDQIRDSLESSFRPEFINRFQFIVPFYPLTKEEVTRIVKKEVQTVLLRDGISERNLAIDVTDRLYDSVVEQGYDVRYGARAIKREIQRQIVLPVATYLAEQRLTPGSILKLDASDKQPGRAARYSTRIKLLDTEQSRQHDRESKPIKRDDGQWMGLEQINEELNRFLQKVNELESAINLDNIQKRISVLIEQQSSSEFWSDRKLANQSIVELDQLRDKDLRMQQFADQLNELQARVGPTIGRSELAGIANQLPRLTDELSILRRQLLVFSDDDNVDALVEIRPISEVNTGRDWLASLYQGWSESAGLTVEILSEPLENKQCILLGVRGAYAFGYLRLETGLHRIRESAGSDLEVVRVTTAPWLKSAAAAEFISRRALKKVGQLGGKIRSSSVIAGHDVVLQNQHTLEHNRQLAADVSHAYTENKHSSDEIVRRYQLEPFEMKDYLTGQTFRRRTILRPDNFNQLFNERVDSDFASI